MIKRAFPLIIGALALLALSAQAQPVPGAATESRDVALRGEVIAFDFSSPVTRIVFDVRNSDGSASPWTAETRSAVELRRFGWTSTSLTPGEMILVRGEVLDAAAGEIALHEIERVNGTRLVPGDSRALGQLGAGTYRLVPGRSYLRISFDHQGFSKASFWFTRMQASVSLNAEGNPESLQVDLVTEDLESGSAELTRLLKSSTLFGAANYPLISFTSQSIQLLDGNRYQVSGELTIKGISQPAQLIAVVNRAGAHPLTGNPGFGISARGSLDRSNWQMTEYSPEIGLGMEMEIEAEFELGFPVLTPSAQR